MATRNRYAELMAQYQQAQPFSFTGYPSTYTGGYDIAPYQPYAAPANRYEEIMAQGTRSGPGGLPIDYNPTWTALSDSEKAAVYAKSPIFSSITQFGQNLFGALPTPSNLMQQKLSPDFVARQKLIAMGIDPATRDYSNEGRNYPDTTGGFINMTPVQGDTSNYSNEGRNAPIPSASSDGGNYSNEGRNSGGPSGGGGGGDGGGGVATGGNNGDASGGGDRGTRGGFAQGGPISMQHLQGPDPMGPDDGYASLKDGEYVINDKAVKKYGIELMNAINSGKISKGKLRGLLEM
jgi:hypothetical protein